MAHVQVDNSGTPSTPASGKTRIFVDSADGHVKRVDDTGTVTDLEAGGGGGEANTASNAGSAGVGPFDAKVGVDLQFRNIAPASSKIAVALNGKDIEVDAVEANFSLGSIGGSLAGDGAHGDLGGGSLHSLVVAAGAAGFMSGADKSKLDGFAAAGEYVRRDGSVAFTGAQSMGNNDLAGAKTVTFEGEHDNGTQGASWVLDWNNGQKQRVVLSASTTSLTMTAPPGVGNFLLKITTTGNFSIAWPASVLWPNGAPPNLTNAGTDIVSFYWDGANYYAQGGGQNFS